MISLIEFKDIQLSCLRWFIGLNIGCFLGLIFAIVSNHKYTSFFGKLTNDFLRAIPIIGLVPVIQMNIGINEYGKIGLIAWAVTFPVWITVRNALSKKMEETELMFTASNVTSLNYFKLLTLPKLIRGLLEGIEIGIGIAWLAVVAAEWVGTYTKGFWSGGLGYKLILGYELNNWAMVHLNLLVFGILGFSSAYFWRFFVKKIFNDKRTFNPTLS